MARGKTHYVVDNYNSKKTACGINRERVLNTAFQELVTCRNCKWSLVYRTKKEDKC